LTFGAFLLLVRIIILDVAHCQSTHFQAGRISDIYHPKPVFVAGFFFIGILGIGAGFVNNIIALVVLRALQGIGAAMTIPSATSMLRAAYATPLSQGIALTL
jgi:MFS family permease